MFLNRWMGRRRVPGSSGRATKGGRTPRFEGLERRDLMATLYVATSGSDGGAGSIASPYKTIQAAVTAAGSGDEIRVAAGTYTYDPAADHYGPKGQFSYSGFLGATPVVAVLGKQVAIKGGFTTSNWSVADPTSNLTVIDGQGTHRGIFVVGQGPTSLDLEGFTVQNALAQGIAKRGGADAVYAFGGGLFADMGGDQGDTSPWAIRDVIFQNNKAVASGTFQNEGARAAGGAIDLRFVHSLTLDHVTFAGNQAIGANGPSAGGGGVGGALHADHSNVTGTYVTFTSNLAKSGDAQGGSGRGSSTGELADALGGALAAINSSQINLDFVSATNNTAQGGAGGSIGGSGFGGAFYGEQTGVTLNIADAFIQGNSALGGSPNGMVGGGAIMTHDANVVLDRSVVVGNVARSGPAGGSAGGGAVYSVKANLNPTVAITNSVIADNSTSGSEGGGGGLWFQGVAATLDQVTIDNNRLGPAQLLGQGILVLNGGTLSLSHSIASNLTGANGGAIDVISNGQVAINGLLAFNDTSLVSAFTKGGVSGANTVKVASPTAALPNLYDSPNSPRWDYHLVNTAANPAINSGGGSSTADADGNPRVGIADLGAFEAITPRIDLATPLRVGAGGVLRVTINRRGDATSPVTVILSAAGGSAQAGTDYVAFNPIAVTFAPFETTKTVAIQTINAGASADKTLDLSLALAGDSTAVARLGAGVATATIQSAQGGGSSTPTGFAVTTVGPIRTGKGIVGAVIQFNSAIAPKVARNLRAYGLHKLFGKKLPRIALLKYNANAHTVTLRFTGPIRAGSAAVLSLNSARLRDAANRPLGGTTSFTLTG